MMNTKEFATVNLEELKGKRVPVKADIIQSILAIDSTQLEAQLRKRTRNDLLDFMASLIQASMQQTAATSVKEETEPLVVTKELCDSVLAEIRKGSFSMFGGYRGIKVFSARQITSRYLRGLHLDDSHKSVSLVLNTMFYNKMFSVFTSKKGIKCIRF